MACYRREVGQRCVFSSKVKCCALEMGGVQSSGEREVFGTSKGTGRESDSMWTGRDGSSIRDGKKE